MMLVMNMSREADEGNKSNEWENYLCEHINIIIKAGMMLVMNK